MCRPIEARESVAAVGHSTSSLFAGFPASATAGANSPTSASPKSSSLLHAANKAAALRTSSSSSSLLAPFAIEANSPTLNGFSATDGMNMLSMAAQPSAFGTFPKAPPSWAGSATDPMAFPMTDDQSGDDIKPVLTPEGPEFEASDLEQLLDFSLPDDPESADKDKDDLINLDDGFDGTEMSILYSFLVDTPQDKSVESKPIPTQPDDGILNLNMLANTPIESLMESLEEDFTDTEQLMISPSTSSDGIKGKLAPEVKSRRLCKAEGCYKRSRSNGLCISHGGGRRCAVEGCDKSSQGGNLCIRHGGGKRCSFEGCDKAAQSNFLCKAHGGGPRCQVDGCTRSSQGGGFCRSHGGGKRCMFDGCTKGTQRGDYCALHGGSRLCEVPGCMRNDRGGGLCATHGGGKRCSIEGCGKPCRRKGLCSAHLRQSEHTK